MNTTNKRKYKKLRKPVKLVISLLVLVCVSVGGTVAYLTSKGSVTNKFTVATVDTKVDEDFDGKKKSNITAKNTGDVPAFVRIKLVTYRINSNGDPIGGKAEIDKDHFTLDSNYWFEVNDCYYYKCPVDPNVTIKPTLTGDGYIELKEYSKDSDGGKQVIEVIAEAIQASPVEAVQEAWGQTVGSDGNLVAPSPSQDAADQQ